MRPVHRARLLPAFVLPALLASCLRDDRPRVVSAEFLDERSPDGLAFQNETIRVTLDRPLPAGTDLARAKVTAFPPVSWEPDTPRPTPDPRVLQVRIIAGTPAFRLEGIHVKDTGATGIGIDLGDGTIQWVDLQPVLSLPVLLSAVWVDASPPGGDLVVDQGDWIRLIFDRPVKLEGRGADALRARAPQDVILTKVSDRLDDGEVYARFEPGTSEREVRIVLGTRPMLTVWGTLASRPEAIDRFGAGAPSGIALNGTPILPMPKIRDPRGGPGAVSRTEVDIEFPEGFPLPQPRPREAFPPPGNRAFHTLTPMIGGQAFVVGGATADGETPTGQVLIYDPFHEDEDPAFTVLGALPEPTFFHTATILAGPDDLLGTFDDVVIIAGGSDGQRSLSTLTVIAPREDGSLAVERLEGSLKVARAEHAAVAVAPNQILIDGGRRVGPEGPAGLVECAELLKFSFEGGRTRLAPDHRVFRTLARVRHTLTGVGPADSGDSYVLAYGGLGRRWDPKIELGQVLDPAAADVFFPSDNAVVLVSPILINVSAPARSFALPYSFDLSLLRWGHAAVPLDPHGDPGAAPAATTVLIAGGTARAPSSGPLGQLSPWEKPGTPEWLLKRPRGHEARTPVVVRFDTAAPERSRIEALPGPAGDSAQPQGRLYFAAVAVPGRGVLLAGGEATEKQAMATVDLFQSTELGLAEAAFRLATSRTRHQAYVVRRGEANSVVFIGGVASPEAKEPVSAVEEVGVK